MRAAAAKRSRHSASRLSHGRQRKLISSDIAKRKGERPRGSAISESWWIVQFGVSVFSEILNRSIKKNPAGFKDGSRGLKAAGRYPRLERPKNDLHPGGMPDRARCSAATPCRGRMARWLLRTGGVGLRPQPPATVSHPCQDASRLANASRTSSPLRNTKYVQDHQHNALGNRRRHHRTGDADSRL